MSDSKHAMCDYYGHDWFKNAGLTARESAGYRVEECKRCGELRRVYYG